MEILIADDDPVARTLLCGLARKLGHNVAVAGNGAEALRAFTENQPDLVLIDGQMPVMDGYEATAQMRALAKHRWTPIMFVAGNVDTTEVVRALDAGADDYLVKPVHPAMLRAKLAAVAHAQELRLADEEQKLQLQRYHDAAEQEGRIALHLMRKLVNAGQLDDPMLKCLVVPVSPNFSGDLVAAARTPRGALHVMLADAVGHGLAAALNVLPIVPTFYAMTAKGFDLDMIAVELNRTLRQYMPVDRFVATTLISLDPDAQRIKVWNGANPPVLVLGDDGVVMARLDSKNLALGVLPEEVFAPVLDVLDYTTAYQVFTCSDGVVEDYGRAADCTERQLRVERMLTETPPALRLKRLRSALAARTGDGSAGDDMTVVLISGNAAATVAAPPPLPAQWKFEVAFDAADLRRLDAVKLLIEAISTVPGAHFHRRPLGMIVTELFANALDYGVLGLPSGLKAGAQGADRHAARAKALAQLEQGNITVHIELLWKKGRPQLDLRFRDSGAGFNQSVLAAGASAASRRGIALVRSLCAGVDYCGCGNDVRVTYVLDDTATESLRAVA